ncbi:MAG: GntR family transcriptional regulator [Burkholderiales bacterium]|nr:GntR family transcriptional regulator [Burkholderiales bacterium]
MSIQFQAPLAVVRSKPGKQVWEAVAEDIKESIIGGRHPPLSRLKEADLAATYAVSKTPIREALRHLERMGFVEVIPHTMVIVRKVDATEARNLFAIQSVLEGLAARQAVPNLHDEHFRVLRTYATLVDRHRDDGNVSESEKANYDFHSVLWNASGNEELLELLQKTHERIQRYRCVTRRDPGRFDDIDPGHAEILDALAGRDQDRSEQILRRHIESYGQAIVELMEGGGRGADSTNGRKAARVAP